MAQYKYTLQPQHSLGSNFTSIKPRYCKLHNAKWIHCFMSPNLTFDSSLTAISMIDATSAVRMPISSITSHRAAWIWTRSCHKRTRKNDMTQYCTYKIILCYCIQLLILFYYYSQHNNIGYTDFGQYINKLL